MSEWVTAGKTPSGRECECVAVCAVSAYECVGVLRQSESLQVKVGGWRRVFDLNSAVDRRVK